MTEHPDFEIFKLSWKKGEQSYIAGTDPANPDEGIFVTGIGNIDVSTADAIKGFMAREKPQFRFPDMTEELVLKSVSRSNDTKVEVLRGSLFFYAGQETTLGNIREFFSEKAITYMEEDKYIKIH